MLDQVVDAEWVADSGSPSAGAPLEPGWLRLKSGLAQVVFYSGARVVIQGPTELELISQNEASCPSGQLVAEVPPQAHGFRVQTPQAGVTGLGTSFGLTVEEQRTEVHVFSGKVELRPASDGIQQELGEGSAAVIEGSQPPQLIVASQTLFAPLFYLKSESVAADAERFERWKEASNELNQARRCSCIWISRAARCPTGGCAMPDTRTPTCPMPRSSVASGRAGAGRKSGHWSFKG